MYAKNNNYVTFFMDESKENTDKVAYGRISEAIKTGRKDGNKEIYEYETWNARFVGKAYEKAIEKLTDKAHITLTEWNVRNPYDKEKKRSYPYILIMDFEIRAKDNNANKGSGVTEDENGFASLAEGEEPPFN